VLAHLALEGDSPGAVCVVGETKPFLQQVEDKRTIKASMEETRVLWVLGISLEEGGGQSQITEVK